MLCLPEPASTFARDSLVIHKKNWKCLDPWAQGVRASEGLLSSTKFSLKSCSRSGKSCNRSLCTSSRPSFLFLFLLIHETNFPVTLHSFSHFFLLLDFPCQSRNPAMKMLKKLVKMTWRNSLTNQGQRMVRSSLYCS